MDPKILKKTQDTLGKIIKKPPLTDKLLGKPPFRFLHDIFTEVIRTTGFLKGLFSPQEMDSKNVTAKEAKLAFLQKVIDCVSLVSGDTLAVRPSKVIAGHEPENTNELLQTIARCIRKKMSSDDAVQMVLSGKSPKTSSKSKSSDKPPSGSKRSETSGEQKEAPAEVKAERSSESVREKSSDRRRRSSSKHKEKDASAEKSRDEQSASRDQDKERRRKRRDEESIPPSKPRDEVSQHSEESSKRPNAQEEVEGTENENSPAPRAPRPASAKGQRRRPHGSRSKPDMTDDTPEAESVPSSKKLARPPSARPAAPRVKQRNEPTGEDHIDSGGQQRSAPIIVDRNFDSSPSDEDEQFVVEEEAVTLHDERTPSPVVNGVDHENGDEKHGSLVKTILETKKELEHSAAGQHAIKKHTEIQRPNATTAQQRKEQEMVVKEIEQLRNSVQKLCQSAAPLAKIIDYIQEDMDAMQNELQFWKLENKQHAVKLKDEEAVTQKNIEPLNFELQELEQNILSYRNQMAATKSNIIRNDEKIRKMVVAVATRS